MKTMHNATSGEHRMGKLRRGDGLLCGIPVVFRERNIGVEGTATSGAGYSR